MLFLGAICNKGVWGGSRSQGERGKEGRPEEIRMAISDLSATTTQAQAGKGYDLDGVMSELARYTRKSEDVPEEIAVTVTAIVEISGKSIKMLFNWLSLLKLPDEMQEASTLNET